jgi:hypothetical protein
MNEKKSDKQPWFLWALAAVVLLVGGVWMALKPEHSEPPTAGGGIPVGQPPEKPAQPLTAECRASLKSQQALARLAVDAMRAYGRIDPGLYDTKPAPEDGLAPIRVSKDAKPLPFSEEHPSPDGLKPPSPLDIFNKTLRGINADAAKDFLTAHDAAQGQCGAACPGTVYPIKVTRLDQGNESEAYDFRVAGALPTLTQWEQGFLAQYAPKVKDCPFASPIELDETREQIQQERGALEPQEKSPAEPPGSADKAAEAARKTGGSDDASKRAKRFTGGTVELDLRCDPVVYDKQCHGCQTAEGNNGGYKKKGPDQSCCYAKCP